MFWNRQNRRDREILAAMAISGHRARASEIYMTAHWTLLPNASPNTSGKVYSCRDGNAIILATQIDECWEVEVRYTNF